MHAGRLFLARHPEFARLPVPVPAAGAGRSRRRPGPGLPPAVRDGRAAGRGAQLDHHGPAVRYDIPYGPQGYARLGVSTTQCQRVVLVTEDDAAAAA
ncbi:hypothetical protein [Streptomyces sp. NPDC126503]|uniref:hypothetical protein n=1 Tax=Streptomyces sp. NPDC126503 TaxID=3155315 RepID=UPI003332DF85